MNGGIYTIRVQGSEKFYIGRTISFSKRKAHHMWLLRRKQHHCKHLQNAFIKYGSVEFVEEIVENDKERRIQLEQEWIDRHKDVGVLVNHQMKATNDDLGGKKWKENRSRIPHNKGKPSPLLGVKRDPAIAKKISETKKKKGQTEKQLLALEKNRKNIDYTKPKKPHSEEAKQRMSAKRKGIKRGPYSALHGEAISRARTGMKFSEEHKANLRSAALRRWVK